MIRVKICGITTSEDARLAAALGASAIGVILWPGSPRCVDVDRARAIVAAVPPLVSCVGVFVNQTTDAAHLAAEIGLSAIQLHGDETPDAYRDLRLRVIKAVAVRDGRAVEAADAVPARTMVLLDAHDPVRRGGTGRPVDWSIAAAIARRRPIILSGGLHAGNLGSALDAVAPYGVDVSSGVEGAVGRKDPDKLRALFAALRRHTGTGSGGTV